jgi:uncharacterized membrane protein YeiH
MLLQQTQAITSIMEHFGVALGALSGVLAARGRQVDFFGVLVLALVTAFGGGSLRDLIASDVPVMWLVHPQFLWNVCITTTVGFIVCAKWTPHPMSLEIADALTMGFFAVVGTRKGLTLGFDNIAGITLGVITGVAGGVFRDVLLGRVPSVFQRGTYFYATAAFIGCAAFCGLRHIMLPGSALWVSTAIIVLVRLVAVRYRLALPVMAAPPERH